MPKKIILFVVVLISLAIVSALVLRFAKPAVANMNPLVSIDLDRINKVMVKDPGFSVTVEKEKGVWHLKVPLKDVADAALMERLVATLKGFTVGSIVSEKTDRYPEFSLSDEQALNVQVSAEGSSAPTLDVLLGKEGPSYGSTFLRFKDRPAVYLAEALPGYMIPRSAEAFRSHRLLETSIDNFSSLSFKTAKDEFTMNRSSQVWLVSGSTDSRATMWATSLSSRLSNLRIQQFFTLETVSKPSGLERPLIEIKGETSNGPQVIVIGQKITSNKADPAVKGQYYATHSDREGVFLIPESDIKELSEQLATRPK